MTEGVISDRYRIEGRLGSGGMSTVYRAVDSILERTVAVKVLAEHLSDDERFVARFRREALAVAKLIHPNIVQVYDTGVDEARHYIVMEYVDGRSGAQILRTEGMVSPEMTVEIGVQACEGLDFAHRHGVVHRDVKPGNLMIVDEPEGSAELAVKLADFGIAMAAEQTRITQVGSVLGTAAYLAPEQARGEEATASSDIYSLGVVLYQFLTGRLPYEGSSLTELAIRQQQERPLPPSTYDDSIPEALGTVVLRTLETDPDDRHATASELAAALPAGLAGRAEPLPDMPDSEEATQVLGGTRTERTRRLPREGAPIPDAATPIPAERPRRRPPARAPRRRSAAGRAFRTVLALLVLVLIAAAVALAVVITTESARDPEVRDVIRQNVNEQVDELRQLVDDNTE